MTSPCMPCGGCYRQVVQPCSIRFVIANCKIPWDCECVQNLPLARLKHETTKILIAYLAMGHEITDELIAFLEASKEYIIQEKINDVLQAIGTIGLDETGIDNFECLENLYKKMFLSSDIKG